MGKNKKDNGGLFPKPPPPPPPKCPPHKNTYRNEHQVICRDCGQVVRDDPH